MKEKSLEPSGLYDIEVDKNIFDKIQFFKKLLLEWNEKMNLTAITDDSEILMKHFVDCLQCTKVITDEKNIIDIGTGAGFPGIVLAIYYPDKNFTLLDGLNKRIMFLEEVVRKLELKNVTLIHGRAEEVVRNKNLFNCFDACVSRAVATLPVLLEFTSPYVKVGGKCFVMKGDNVDAEIDASKNALKTLNLEITDKMEYSYTVNGETYNRCILDIKKVKDTPKMYPRNYGRIKKKPL